MGKTRSTTTVKKKKGDSSSTSQPVRSTRSTNPHPLRLPLEEKKKDQETKNKGPGPNVRRKGRHEDVLRRLRSIIIKDKDQTQGPAGEGLFRIPYKHTYPLIFGRITRKMDLRDFVRKEKKDVKTGLWEGVDVEDEELQKFLQEVLSERPYVTFREGMKAVLGSLYISREVQGDFIYLNQKEQSSLFGDNALLTAAKGGEQEENYFSLESKNGDTWISIDGVEGVLPRTVVSVNGDALCSSGAGTSTSSVEGMRKLEFGDIITVSANKGDKVEEWERTDFLFKPSEVSGKGKNGQDINPIVGGSSSPLDIPLILAKVFYFLPTNEVKKARRVSHLWNEEALQALRKRTQEVAVRVFDQVVIGSGDKVRRMTVFNPLPEALLKFPNWKLALPRSRRRQMGENDYYSRSKKEKDLVTGFLKCLEEQRIRMTEQKTLDDMKGLFFGSQKRHVKSLHLTVGTEREAHLRILEVMIGGVKDTLKALTLRLAFEVKSIPLTPSSLVELPCLSHLCLDLDINSGCIGSYSSEASAKIKRFLASFLLPAVGNIQSLTILHRSSSHEALEEIAKMQDQEDPSTKFGRLSQVQIQESSDKALKALSSLRNDSLRTLELGGIDSEDTALLWQAQERFSKSLQELKLGFVGNPTLYINFPARMKNLTALSVFLWWDWDEMDPSRTHVRFGPPGPNEEDDHQRMNDDIDYIRHFPSLVNLTVASVDRNYGSEMSFPRSQEMDWRTFHPFLSAFLPTERRVPSIRTLDIPFLLKGKYHTVLDNLEAIFPSVVFSLEQGLALVQARGGPIWTQEDDDEDRRARESDSD